MTKLDRELLSKLDRIILYLTERRASCDIHDEANWNNYNDATVILRDCRRLVAEEC
jgi:hypothetical protein